MPTEDGQPPFDEQVALGLMGSLVLLGITYEHNDGSFDRQEQIFGRVVKANAKEGICLLLEGAREGEYFWLPPTTEPYEIADDGVYTLRSTGETVTNPDYLSTWTFTAGKKGG